MGIELSRTYSIYGEELYKVRLTAIFFVCNDKYL